MSSNGDAGRVDFGLLDRLAAGDRGLMREVLEIFLEEFRRLEGPPGRWPGTGSG